MPADAIFFRKSSSVVQSQWEWLLCPPPLLPHHPTNTNTKKKFHNHRKKNLDNTIFTKTKPLLLKNKWNSLDFSMFLFFYPHRLRDSVYPICNVQCSIFNLYYFASYLILIIQFSISNVLYSMLNVQLLIFSVKYSLFNVYC